MNGCYYLTLPKASNIRYPGNNKRTASACSKSAPRSFPLRLRELSRTHLLPVVPSRLRCRKIPCRSYGQYMARRPLFACDTAQAPSWLSDPILDNLQVSLRGGSPRERTHRIQRKTDHNEMGGCSILMLHGSRLRPNHSRVVVFSQIPPR